MRRTALQPGLHPGWPPLRRVAVRWRAACLVGAMLLAACQAPPPVGTPPPPPPPAAPVPVAPPPAPAAPPRPSLAAEQRRLSALFRGTPVVFAMQPDASLRITVPLRFCFDAGKTAVKPPLAAVLDRLAASQHESGSLIIVSASFDPSPKTAKAVAPALLAKRDVLTSKRAESVRDHLVEKGIADTRVTFGGSAGAASGASGAGVRLIVRESPAP